MRDLKFYLTVCAELWEWLSENPERKKADWPCWEKYGNMNANCPMCEYRFQNNLLCNECPLKALWHGYCYCVENDDESYNINSPYFLWEKGIARVENALKIANYCRKLIKELEAK